MYMSHSILATVWMTNPLQILQAQVLRAGVFQPTRRRQAVQTSRSTSPGVSIPAAATAAPAPSLPLALRANKEN